MSKLNELIVSTKKNISIKAGRAGLVLEKYSPEIKVALGLAAFAGTVVMAYKAGTKINAIIEHHAVEMEKIKNAEEEMNEDPNAFEEETGLVTEDLKAARFATNVDFAKDLAKEFLPVIGLATLSITLMLSANHTLKQRYVGAVAAYNALSGAFEKYRSAVKDRFGDEVDYELKHGIVKAIESREITDEKGKKKVEEAVVTKFDPSKISDQAVWFCEGNPNWDPDRMNINRTFLKAQQSMATEILLSRGHLFLNEVYDMIGIPHTPEGQIVGWLKGAGDDYVDFGLYDDRNTDFINGNSDRGILLDFNHDGPIWDKI